MKQIKNKMFILVVVSGGLVVASMNACSPFQPSGHELASVSQSSVNGSTDLLDDVQSILKANCISCHGPGSAATSFDLASNDDFIKAGLIVPGKPAQSKLIFRLKNFSGGAAGSNNMPMGSAQLTESQFQILYGWVLDMPSASSPFQCSDDSLNLAELSPTNIRRLSVKQYRNTLIDLFSLAVNRSQVTTRVDTSLSQTPIPADTGAPFKRENNGFEDSHATAFFDIAHSLATALSANHANAIVTQFIALNPGNCTSVNTTNLSENCRVQFVRNFASRAFRRPLRETNSNLTTTDNQVINETESFAVEFNGVSTQVAVNNLIFRILLSPHFLYQIEDQNLVTTPYAGSSNVYQLSSFAIINRLSYRFWNSMPDEMLWNLAMTKDLNDDSAYLEAITQIASSTAKLESSLKEYYYDWLHLDRTPRFNVNSRFAILANGIQFSDALRTSMMSEVEELGSYITTSGGNFNDLFTTDISFARDTNLMAIYGVTQPAPSAINPNNAVRFPAGQRSGVLTRAALLISGSEISSPILRGAHLRKNILCLNLGQPPGNALQEFNNIQTPANASTRERVDIKTSGNSCVGCHSLINPFGFGLSHYNSFGMYMNQEPILNSSGTAISTYANINASVDLSFSLGPNSNAKDGVELSSMVANQASVRACFAEKFMTYAFNRSADRTKDACRLEKIYNNLDNEGKLIDMIRSSAMDREFRIRKIQ